jgi:hypothetical protein
MTWLILNAYICTITHTLIKSLSVCTATCSQLAVGKPKLVTCCIGLTNVDLIARYVTLFLTVTVMFQFRG